MVYLAAAWANVCVHGANKAPDGLGQYRPAPILGLPRIPEKSLFFLWNVAGCSVAPEVTDCCPKRTAAARTHGSRRTCHAFQRFDPELDSALPR